MSLEDKFINYEYSKKDISDISVKNKDDLAYMDSVSSAILMQNTISTKILLWIGLFVVIWLVIWAYNAKIDSLTRGEGKVIPSNKVQIIQNLEGGIVSEILVEEGDTVKKGDVLVKIDDTGFLSTYSESILRFNELQAKAIRLFAESTDGEFNVPENLSKSSPELVRHEYSLYKTNKEQLDNNIAIYIGRLEQKENELKEAKSKLMQLIANYELISKEVALNKPLVDKGIVSEVEFLQLQRQQNSIKGEMDSIKLSIPRLLSVINEQKNNIKEVKLNFSNKAKEQYNETKAEMERLRSLNVAREDKVNRTMVRSPVNGTIKQLLINTIGGVVKPGMDIVEIVPTQDNLLIEAKVRPADIAFLYPGQRAIVKFSAYDFAIYGSLEGTLTHISADTIIDNIDKQSYYQVRIKTDKNYLGNDNKKLYVMVGMTVSVDIKTGKKSVLDYILKPILRARENVLSER